MPTTVPRSVGLAEAREHAVDMLIIAGVADVAALVGAIGAAVQHHGLAVEAAERHTGSEWLYQRAVGAGQVIAAMGGHLA